jgi:hypothetical protein
MIIDEFVEFKMVDQFNGYCFFNNFTDWANEGYWSINITGSWGARYVY